MSSSIDLKKNIDYFFLVFKSLVAQIQELKAVFVGLEFLDLHTESILIIENILISDTDEIVIVYKIKDTSYSGACTFQTFIKKIKK